MNDEDREICKKAIEKWGEKAQLWKVVEECAELIKAVAKYANGEGDAGKVISEATDVEWMLKQLELMVGTESDWSVERLATKADLKFKLGIEELT